MKYVKTLGLAVVLAAALAAFAGASPASATVLCKTNLTSGCAAAGWDYAAGTTIHAVNVGKVITHTEFQTIECNKSTFHGTTTNTGSSTETVKGVVEVWTFEECSPCSVKVLKTGSFEIHWISSTTNASLTSSGAEFTEECTTIFGKIHCIYTTNATSLGTITGGSPAKADINASIPRISTNALCDGENQLTATYEVTQPTPLFFSSS